MWKSHNELILKLFFIHWLPVSIEYFLLIKKIEKTLTYKKIVYNKDIILKLFDRV